MRSLTKRLYRKKILASLLRFLRDQGLGKQEIGLLFRECVQDVFRETKDALPSADCAAVLQRWYRDPSYLDEDARPLAIRVRGAKPSIESLIREEGLSSSAQSILKVMKELGLVKRNASGFFYPKKAVATINKMHPVLVEHVAESIERLLQTVHRNTSEVGKAPLIERYTHVVDLEPIAIDEFRRFSQSQGGAFLESVEDWLQANRVKKGRKGMAAGIHVIAFAQNTAS